MSVYRYDSPSWILLNLNYPWEMQKKTRMRWREHLKTSSLKLKKLLVMQTQRKQKEILMSRVLR